MAKKRKTEPVSKNAVVEPPQLPVMKNGKQQTAAEKMSPPAPKRKKTSKKQVLNDSESGRK